ncbi:hypothetical protein N7534_000539 [Penicillium rubens]|nr:hypothetical protein N7534_000539 [Penicillium rubens]
MQRHVFQCIAGAFRTTARPALEWQPPATWIAPDKDIAIKEHDLILRATPLYGPSSANAYTNGSRTERESVGASAVTSKGNATARLNSQDTVHAAEIKGILLALSQIKDDLVRELAATSRAPRLHDDHLHGQPGRHPGMYPPPTQLRAAHSPQHRHSDRNPTTGCLEHPYPLDPQEFQLCRSRDPEKISREDDGQ